MFGGFKDNRQEVKYWQCCITEYLVSKDCRSMLKFPLFEAYTDITTVICPGCLASKPCCPFTKSLDPEVMSYTAPCGLGESCSVHWMRINFLEGIQPGGFVFVAIYWHRQ